MRQTKIWKAVALFFVLIGLWWLPQTLTALTEDEQNTIAVVKKSVDSVVFITNIQLVRDFFYREDAVARGSGSGFIWDNQGHIVTNYHVIEDGDIFAITLPNQQQRKARLIGKEPNKDIAVLKIEGDLKELNALKVGSSKILQVGQKVVAIGNPFGFDHTVTTGIVSALGRQMMGVGGVTIRDMIQTDASINPGNSGGALLNSDGELIGMSTMIYSSTGTSAGIGFAVPVDTIKKIVPQIIRYGKVIRPGLGISLLQDSYAKRVGIVGVAVVDVPAKSEASRLGIQGIARNRYGELYIQDIIVGIDDHKIASYDDLYNVLESYRIGETITLVLNRDKRERKVRFTLVGTD